MPPKSITPQHLKSALHDGGEIALLDAREELPFGARHHLMASCVPLSRLEFMVDDLVPRRAARVVWCDDGEGLAGTRGRAHAAARLHRRQLVSMAGSRPGRRPAFASTAASMCRARHSPRWSSTRPKTPYISVHELQAMIDSKADIAIYDSRSFEEYHNNCIPTAISVPGAELVYRFADLAPSPETLVVVNCGGRTRSIIGAQSLIAAGVRNKVVSLKDGTMAWHLAGLEVVHGAERRPPDVSAQGLQCRRRRPPQKSPRAAASPASTGRHSKPCAPRPHTAAFIVLDVRTPAEYAAGHLRGARSAPGGQLVQETDYHLATWGARVVLVDDNGVRATMTASWLKQMGWGCRRPRRRPRRRRLG